MKSAPTLLGPWMLLILSACTVTGTGHGQLSGAVPEPVRFGWVSSDGGMSGTMTAVLTQWTFVGRFFQITQQTRAESLTPLWQHWNHGWHDWPDASVPWTLRFPFPEVQFVTHYSGRVVATLDAPDGQRMRCRFHLVLPSRGMSSGGQGQCQLQDGRMVPAVFDAN